MEAGFPNHQRLRVFKDPLSENVLGPIQILPSLACVSLYWEVRVVSTRRLHCSLCLAAPLLALAHQ